MVPLRHPTSIARWFAIAPNSPMTALRRGSSAPGRCPGALPAGVARVSGMEQQLRIQDGAAQALKRVRHEHGALVLSTIEARAVYDCGGLPDLKPDGDNRAKELIEYFMIAANGVVAQYLERRGSSSLRRVLRAPQRWGRDVRLARGPGERRP